MTNFAQDKKWRSIIKLILKYYAVPGAWSAEVSDRTATQVRVDIKRFGNAWWSFQETPSFTRFWIRHSTVMKKYFGSTKSILVYPQTQFLSWVNQWEKLESELEPDIEHLESKVNTKFEKLERNISDITDKLNAVLELLKAKQ